MITASWAVSDAVTSVASKEWRATFSPIKIEAEAAGIAWLTVPKSVEAPDLSEDNAWYRETLMELLDLLAAGKIKPVVAERIPLVEAARAHELLERGGYAGKVVLVTST